MSFFRPYKPGQKPSAGLIGLISNKAGLGLKLTRKASPTAQESRELQITALMGKYQDDGNSPSRLTMPITDDPTGPEESRNAFQPRFHRESLGSMETPSRPVEAADKSRIPIGSSKENNADSRTILETHGGKKCKWNPDVMRGQRSLNLNLAFRSFLLDLSSMRSSKKLADAFLLLLGVCAPYPGYGLFRPRSCHFLFPSGGTDPHC